MSKLSLELHRRLKDQTDMALDAIDSVIAEIDRKDAKIESDAKVIAALREALQAIIDLCKTSPANPFLADDMDRIAIAALAAVHEQTTPEGAGKAADLSRDDGRS